MAESNKISKDQVFEKDWISSQFKDLNTLKQKLDAAAGGLKSMLTTTQKILVESKGKTNTADDIKKINKAVEDSQKGRKLYVATLKEQVNLQIKEEQLKQQQLRTQKAQNAENVKEEKQRKALGSAYAQASAKLNEMRKRYKDLAVEEKENTKTGKLLRDEIKKLDKQLKDVDATVGQFQRNVGNYKDSIKDFVKELVTMGFWLKVAKEAASLVKDELFKNQDVVDEVAIKTAQLADSTSGFTGANERAAKSVIVYRKTLLLLEETLAQVNLDLEDQQEISDDITIGFETRNIALEKSIKLGKQAANIELIRAKTLDIQAQAEFEAAKANARGGKQLAKADEKRLASAKALEAANDKLNDLARINDTDRRKRALEQASFEVGLLIKKKESANAEKVILESQLADERLQLEERIKLSAKLLKVEKATTDAAIKIIKDETKIKFDAKSLLEEKDADALRLKIENIEQDFINAEGKKETTKIGREAAELIAKVIKKAQDSTLEFEERKRKFAEEEIDRKNRILEIENEIDELNNNQAIKRLEDTLTEEQELAEYFNEKSLEDRAIYNETFQNLRREQSDKVIAEEMNITNEKIKQLELQAKNDKAATETEIKDDLERATEKKAIEAKLLIDIENLKTESNKRTETEAEKQAKIEAEINKKKLEQIAADKEAAADQTEELINNLLKVTKAVEDELDKQNAAKIAAIDKELELREKAVDRQTELANNGQANQLAFEEKMRKDAELKRLDAEKKAQKQKEALQLAEALLNAYNAELKQPNANSNTAAIKALAGVLGVKGIAKGLAGLFFEGTENVAEDLKGNKVHNGRDGYVIGVDGSERILTGEQNKMIGNLTNDELAKLAFNYQVGNVSNATDTMVTNRLVLDALIQVKNEIRNKPVQIWEANKIGELVEKNIKDGFTEKVTYKKYKFH